MHRRFTVTLVEDAAKRLSVLAHAERRDPRGRAALILERALARRGRRSLPRGGTASGAVQAGHQGPGG